MTTKMPTEKRTIRMEPELEERVVEMLKPLTGKKLEAAQEAVRKVHASAVSGEFDTIVGAYREAVKGAVASA
jgi:hypothetical protein